MAKLNVINNVLLNIEDLDVKKEPTPSSLETFTSILKSCHSHIQKLNKKNIKACYYLPPYIILGRPTYDYNDLLLFIMKSLDRNGLFVSWSNEEDSIYISWRSEDLSFEKYKVEANLNGVLNQNGKYCVIKYNNGNDYLPININ